MPTITLQVGQCGNQVGQQLWRAFDRQGAPGDAKANLVAGCVAGCDSEFFRETQSGGRVARCLLVDTEPKVVRTPCGPRSSLPCTGTLPHGASNGLHAARVLFTGASHGRQAGAAAL